MNLFWKKLFGKLQSTEKYEEEKKRLFEDFNRYAAVRESDLMKEYNELISKVNTPDFKANEKALTTRKYKDTEEYRDMTKFQEYQKLEEKSKLKGDSIIKEYEALKVKVNSADFKKRNDFWSNPKRYETTEEFKLEQRVAQIEKDPDYLFFTRCNYKRFAFIDNFEEVFNDTFSYAKLTDGAWKPGFHCVSDQLKSVHSFLNERQANNGGKNVQMNGALMIHTKSEKKQAAAWHPLRGFVMQDYDYTSDVINGYDAIRTNKGLFRAKMRFTGSTDLCHAFWLVGDHKAPHINVVKCVGGKLEVGVYYVAAGGVQYTRETIKGINPQDWWYYEVQWDDKGLVWYINNLEVFRTSAVVPNEDMFPMFNSFIPENMKGGDATMEVDHDQVLKLK